MALCIIRVHYVLQVEIINMLFMLQAILKQIMPRLKPHYLNVIWDKGILQNLFLRWTWLIGNLCYSMLREAISVKYNACFPYRKISKKVLHE